MLFDIYHYSKTHSRQTEDDGFGLLEVKDKGADPSSDTRDLDLFFFHVYTLELQDRCA